MTSPEPPQGTPAGLAGKGPFFFLNLLTAAAGAALLCIFVSSNIYNKQGLNPEFLAYVLVISALLICYAMLTFFLKRKGNTALFSVMAAALLLPELAFVFMPPGMRKHIYNLNYIHHPAPYMMFTNKPGASFTMPSEEGRQETVLTNSLGLRIERPFEKEKPAGEFRVLMLGASTVFEGVPLARSLAGRLESLALSEGRKSVKIYNCGVVGYNSGQELALLMHTLVDYRPDLVIVYDGGNDITVPYLYDPRPGFPLNFMIFETGYLMMEKRIRPDRMFSLLAVNNGVIRTFLRSALVQHLVPLAALREKAGYRTPAWEAGALDIYSANLEKMCRLSQGFGFKLAIFLQPLVFTKKPQTAEEGSLAAPPDFARYVDAQYPHASKALEGIKRRHATRGKVVVADLSGALSGYNGRAFNDFIHLNDAAREFMAGKIYSELAAGGLLPAPSRH